MDTFKLAEIQHTVIDTVEYVKRTDVIAFYEDIINSQASLYNTFITILLAIMVALLTATWWWNYSASKKQISSEIDDAKKDLKTATEAYQETVSNKLNKYKAEFNELKGNLQESVNRQIEGKIKEELDVFDKTISDKITTQNKEFDEKMYCSRAEIARIFAAYCESENDYIAACDWWFEVIECCYKTSVYSKESIGDYIRSLHSLMQKINIDKINSETSFTCTDNIVIAEKYIPDILSPEKKAILKKLNEIKAKMTT